MPQYIRKLDTGIVAQRWNGTLDSAMSIVAWIGSNRAKYFPHVDAFDNGTVGCSMEPARLEVFSHGQYTVMKAGEFVVLETGLLTVYSGASFENIFEEIVS